MKTKVAAIYGKRDVRLRVFELPEITDNELLVSVFLTASVYRPGKRRYSVVNINAYPTI